MFALFVFLVVEVCDSCVDWVLYDVVVGLWVDSVA